MNAERLLAFYDKVAETPGAVDRLRRFVLNLAVRGKLVEQDPTDEPAEEIFIRSGTAGAKLPFRRSERHNETPNLEMQIPRLAPRGWMWVPLGATGRIFSGNSINAATRARLEASREGRPFVATKDIGYGFDPIDYENGLLVPIDDQSFKVARSGAVFICAEGGSAGRKIALSDREISFGNKLLANETRDFVVPEFVRLTYMSDDFYSAFAERMTGVIGGISIGNFVQLPFALPPLAEQRRIVVKVEELMALLNRLETARAAREAVRDRLTTASFPRLTARHPDEVQENVRFALDALPALTTRADQIDILRQTIINLAVGGKLVAQDLRDEPVSALLKSIEIEKAQLAKQGAVRKQQSVAPITEDERWFNAPSGWAWVRLMQVGHTQTGTSPSSSKPELFGGPIPFIKPGDLDGNSINYDGLGLSADGVSQSRIAPANSVMMVCIGATLGKVNINDRQVCFNQQINSVTPFKEGMHKFLALALRSSDFQAQAWARAGTATLPIISKGKWEVLPIPLPPLGEQHRIVEKVDVLMSLCDKLATAVTIADTTRARLLESLLHEALTPPPMAQAA